MRVEWVDACDDGDLSWKELTESDVTPLVTNSVGWMVKHDAEHIVLAHTINACGHTAGRITIPTPFMRKITRI